METRKQNSDNKTNNQKQKYIFICGGGISGLGKGVVTSSIALILKQAGFAITVIKIDPYLNIDAGTMSPFEHGEVFITQDGGEVDLDIGNYERFLNIKLTKNNNITTGKIYQNILNLERRGQYLGKTVQVVPHVTQEIKKWINDIGRIPSDNQVENKELKSPEIVLVEVGGTVGDIESGAYYEAIRQMIWEQGQENFCVVFLSHVPVIDKSGEQKTKPTQHGSKELRQTGINPDIIICRSREEISEENRKKIALYTSLQFEQVLSCQDVNHLYQVPLLLQKQYINQLICKKLNLDCKETDLKYLFRYIIHSKELKKKQAHKIAIIGKYTQFLDAYISLSKALDTAAVEADINLQYDWIESEKLESLDADQTNQTLNQYKGFLIPGGFGPRGTEGKIIAIKYARENNIPLFGICFGFQLTAIEYARNVMAIKNATTQEFDEKYDIQTHVVKFMPDSSLENLGGTMRLGAKKTKIVNQNSLAYKLYGQEIIIERHRHRYEINPSFIDQFQQKGMIFSGIDAERFEQRMSILEIQGHKFFLGTQYHPEMQSYLNNPSRPFLGFILAVSDQLEERLNKNDGLLKVENKWQQLNLCDYLDIKDENIDHNELYDKFQQFMNQNQ